jgi:hypothetical protein
MTTVDLRGVIQALVDRWLASPSSNAPDLVDAVHASGALPVYVGMGGTLFLRPDGEILILEGGSNHDPQVETDLSWRITAVVVGVEKYPELRPLLPARPPGTEDCEACHGRGRVHIGGIDYRFLCGTCYGLGWLGGAV